MNHLIFDQNRRVAVHFSGKKCAPADVPLVLLHGFCEDASLWTGLSAALADLPVVAIDLPGFGQSDLPAEPTMEAYATAVHSALDALGIARCVLVGHSLGGYVALEFAARWPDRLAGMGLFHSHPFPDNEERKTARMRGVEMVRSGKRDLYVAQLFPNLFAPAFAQAHPETVQALITTGRRQPEEGIASALLAMKSRADHQETLKAAGCPVLLLLGTEDGLVPIDQAWQAALLPDLACIELLPGVAHMGMYEAPAQSAAVLRKFYATACLLR